MTYSDIQAEAQRAMDAGSTRCLVRNWRRGGLPSGGRPVAIGRGSPPTKVAYVEERDGFVFVAVYVETLELLEWARKPRTHSGEVPRIIDVCWSVGEKVA